MTLMIKMKGFEADVVRKSIKNIYLKICLPDGKIRISAPIQMKIEEIKRLVISKLNWIEKQQENIRNKKTNFQKYTNNETHYYRGESYKLRIVYNKLPFVKLIDKQIILHTPPESSIEYRRTILNIWYRNQLMILIEGITLLIFRHCYY